MDIFTDIVLQCWNSSVNRVLDRETSWPPIESFSLKFVLKRKWVQMEESNKLMATDNKHLLMRSRWQSVTWRLAAQADIVASIPGLTRSISVPSVNGDHGGHHDRGGSRTSLFGSRYQEQTTWLVATSHCTRPIANQIDSFSSCDLTFFFYELIMSSEFNLRYLVLET